MVNGKIISSHVAGVSVPLREKMEHARAGWSWIAVALAIGFIPVVGVAASAAIDWVKNSVTANRQKEVLADHYKMQVAAALGIDPDKVDLDKLKLAADINPMIKGAVDRVDQERDSANRAAALGMTGAYVTGAALAPVIGGITNGVAHGVAKVATDIPGFIAGSAVSSLFDKDVLAVQDVVEIIDEKHRASEEITPKDILMLRIAQSEALQADIKKLHAKPFHKMNEAEQQMVIASLPNGLYAEAQDSAAKLASGQMTPQNLLMPMPANSWAERTGGQRPASGSFAERYASKGKSGSFVEAQLAREAAPSQTQIS